ncbi:MAG: hypothetical protein HYX69_20240 [Planctomycetia bacterium]|nr:hypothetical protein [Planctomycetia bacterium]
MFRRKYHVIFAAIALVAVVLLFVFQMMDDGGLQPGPAGQPQEAILDPPTATVE